jgi:hypothetical protein
MACARFRASLERIARDCDIGQAASNATLLCVAREGSSCPLVRDLATPLTPLSPTIPTFRPAGPRGPALLQDIWLLEKLANFDREVIPERRMHVKGWGAHGTFTTTRDITRYTRAKIFSQVGKKTPMCVRFSTVAGERGAADAERDIRGIPHQVLHRGGNWDIVGNNTSVFLLPRSPEIFGFEP